SGPDAPALVFKGGTSLSKAHHAIPRFSEDVDVTYDIRALLGEHVGGGMPPSRKQAQKWTDEVRDRLPEWIASSPVPLIRKGLETLESQRVDLDHDDETVTLGYQPVAEISYIKPIVKIEFGARSTGEPAVELPVLCDAEDYLSEDGVQFPRTTPRVMAAERTFWEKATAIHVFCIKGSFRGGDRFARHWYDIVKLDETGFADKAIAAPDIGDEVALHKSYFFREPEVDYAAAVQGGLQLVPEGDAVESLEKDYELMRDSNMFINVEPEPFDDIIERCKDIQDKANKARSAVIAN
ncbi:MAG TPA: nucleotidyl transferase AbiEii/AbiGii toxin family protein, partial [Nitrospira sp.]|nr:nucleotidyl transferase AbiEii/AbiGii toxin family protein [Nitrospira sp.]